MDARKTCNVLWKTKILGGDQMSRMARESRRATKAVHRCCSWLLLSHGPAFSRNVAIVHEEQEIACTWAEKIFGSLKTAFELFAGRICTRLAR